MDPQAEKVPGLALPKPSPEQGSYNDAPQAARSHEAVLPALESAPLPVTAPPIVAPQMPAVPFQQVTAVAPVAPAASSMPTTTVADDNMSALDEEWIDKAKAIVEQTKHDPHLESSELSKAKADYLRIRYNKHIKVAEESR